VRFFQIAFPPNFFLLFSPLTTIYSQFSANAIQIFHALGVYFSRLEIFYTFLPVLFTIKFESCTEPSNGILDVPCHDCTSEKHLAAFTAAQAALFVSPAEAVPVVVIRAFLNNPGRGGVQPPAASKAAAWKKAAGVSL